MSAPKNAITLEQEMKNEGNTPEAIAEYKHTLPSASCICGWRGFITDMLVDPTAGDDGKPIPPNQFWCPNCLSIGWWWD